MTVLNALSDIWHGHRTPFLIHPEGTLAFSDLIDEIPAGIATVNPGDVVALVGDFTPSAIGSLLHLIDRHAIIVPLTGETATDHEYFFQTAMVDVVLRHDRVERRIHQQTHPLLQQLRQQQRGGLILFSSGSTGRPKAILHDMNQFLSRFLTPRHTLRTLSFLLFDHIGGLNTLFHTLYNRGVIIVPRARSVGAVLQECAHHAVELLPTTPTFLRMLLLSGLVPTQVPDTLQLITYGTERMDQTTLDELCTLMPNVDFRQTYGMSELGILRVKSEARNSLFMQIGGEGVETRVLEGVLQIRSRSRMLGYLNQPTPFDQNGWYNTQDRVDMQGPYIKIVGRDTETINVGGLKFMAADIERVALEYPGIELAKVTAKPNPITGQHVELTVQATAFNGTRDDFVKFLSERLSTHMVPRRIRFESVPISHRFKRS
jgi:acyl-CoA synthetase (AMP-forming)/AMP-acid ligase II